MRPLARLGVWYPIDRLDAGGIRRLLRTVEDLGYSSFWYPEALGYESLSIASFMLANTERLIIGSSIANIYARDPFTARRGLRTLSSLYDDRFVLGLGVSHAPMVERVRGHVYDKPVPTMRRYLDCLYEDPSNAQDWPVVIAALGPLMLKLAAERTAGAVPYNVTPEHTREARAALGADKLLVVEQKVCLETDPATARGLGRRELHRYMTLTNYRNNWLRIGFTEADLGDDGSDRFIDAMVLWGDAKTIARGLRAHLDAGATQVSKMGKTNISPPLTSVSLAGPFRFEITADHVDLGDLVVPVLLVVEEVTKLAYGEMVEATPENTVAFLAPLVAEFPQKIDAVTTDICPAFTHVREAFGEYMRDIGPPPCAARCRPGHLSRW